MRKTVLLVLSALIAGGVLFFFGEKVVAEVQNYRSYRSIGTDAYIIRKSEVQGVVTKLQTQGYQAAIDAKCKPLPIAKPTPAAKK